MWLWVAGLWVATAAAAVLAVGRTGTGPRLRGVGSAVPGVLSLTLLVCVGPRRGHRACPTCGFYSPARAAQCSYCGRACPAAQGAG